MTVEMLKQFARGVFNMKFETFAKIFDEEDIYSAPKFKQNYVQEKFTLMQTDLLKFLGILDDETMQKFLNILNNKQ